ncbi:MAG TPA: DUF2188 domain-containing protein [Methylomirabilota bacterium]|nr:DUF2188 domain-containing protein [Methylomirabilota bacterium]
MDEDAMGRRQDREQLTREAEPASPEKPKSRRRRLLAAGIGAVAALAAGAVAIRRAAIREGTDRLSVVRLEPDRSGWKITVAGQLEPHGRYQNKKAGVAAARALARGLAPSELVIYRRDGREQDRHRYEPSAA